MADERTLDFSSEAAYAASLKKGGDVKNETTAGKGVPIPTDNLVKGQPRRLEPRERSSLK